MAATCVVCARVARSAALTRPTPAVLLWCGVALRAVGCEL
jgi:hypothetical protein